MSAIDVRAIASIPTEPWRNGGGVTRTFATGGNEWRISLAEVERDGPYSRFAGLSRTSLVLRGGGVTLRNNESVILLKPFQAVEYDGETEWKANLVSGPVTALNVMCARGRYRTQVRAIVDTIIVQPNCTAVVVALDSGCSFSELATTTSGDVAPRHVMVVSNVNRPLRLVPRKSASTARGVVKLPVLVTIEPAAVRMND